MAKKAFTLSEVLLVLSVIGVVTAFTIPSLISNASDRTTKVTWRKKFSEIQQAFLSSQGPDDTVDWNEILQPSAGLPQNQRPVRLVLHNYFKTIKECVFPNNVGNCWAKNVKRLDGQPIESGTGYFNDPPTDDGGFVLNDGTLMVFQDNNGPKYVWVDINGFKQPNVVGKDIFAVQITPTGLKPLGSQDADSHFQNTSSTTGYGASLDILWN